MKSAKSSGTPIGAMFQKKTSPDLLVPPRKKLELLYARREAIDTLIQSLERYDKFRARAMEPNRRKTA